MEFDKDMTPFEAGRYDVLFDRPASPFLVMDQEVYKDLTIEQIYDYLAGYNEGLEFYKDV